MSKSAQGTLFVIDIDNTIADASRRFKKAGKEPSRKDKVKYNTWVEAVQNAKTLAADKPIPGMLNLVKALLDVNKIKEDVVHDVVFITSREERWYEVTHEWFKKHGFQWQYIIFRPNYDFSETHLLKEKQIKGIVESTMKEVVVIDDDPSGKLAKVCKRNGWTFLKVGGG